MNKNKFQKTAFVFLIALLMLNFVSAEEIPRDPLTKAHLIVEYDHDLTSSSERYILTGDEYWKNNYDEIGVKLDDLIKGLKAEAETPELVDLWERQNKANLKLVDMELQAHALVKEGKKDEARALIESAEYVKWKEIYSDTINEYLKSLGIEVEEQDTFEEGSIQQKAKDIAKQVEIYLKSNPTLTVEDLQKDAYFREIAIQPVGKTGTTAVYDYDNLIQLFSDPPEYENMELNTLKDIAPELWAITEKTKGGHSAEGFSKWPLPDGSYKSQYVSVEIVNLRTADGVGLGVVAAANLDDYDTKSVSEPVKESFAEKSIRQKAENVAKQIEIYIQSNPEKTIHDLQNDSYFQEITVQQVGKTGYTAVTDYDTLTCRFHSNPKIVDMDLHNLAEKLPGFWSIMSKTEWGKVAEGIYDWEEADGSIKQKYMYIAIVDAKTAEGVGLSVAATTYLDEYEEEENNPDSKEFIDSKLDILSDKIDTRLENIENDLLFISGLSDLNDLINGDNSVRDDLANLIFSFSENKNIYYQIRYLDESGKEVVRINSINNKAEIVSEENLQNKKGRYYFDNVMQLEKGDIYISPLDLNIEGGELENRGTGENPIYVPVIRYGTPVFDEQNNQKGIVLLNVYANDILDGLKQEQAKLSDENIYLVNSEGNFLFHPDKSKEFGFMFEKDITILNKRGEKFQEIFSNDLGTIQKDDKSFIYKKIFPSGLNQDKDNYWVLIIEYAEELEDDEQDSIQKAARENIRKEKLDFNYLLQKDTEILQELLSTFMEKEDYKKVFLEGDREKLSEYSKELFNKNKEEYDVTHFYYHRPDGTNLVRVHNKNVFDDNITRITFNKAKQSNSWGTGIELGKTAFALRVVHPYVHNDELIGYVEFGQEIDHILKLMKERTGDDYAIVVKKEYIDEDKWATLREEKGLRNNYHDSEEYVLIDLTDDRGFMLHEIKEYEEGILGVSDNGDVWETHKVGFKTYMDGAFALYDAGNNRVGAVIVIQDVSEFIEETDKQIVSVNYIIIFIAIAGILIVLLFLFSIDTKNLSGVMINYALSLLSIILFVIFFTIRNNIQNIHLFRLEYAPLLCFCFYIMISLFHITYPKISKKVLFSLHAMQIFLSILILFTNLFFESATPITVQYGPLFNLGLALMVLYLVAGLAVLFSRYMKKKETGLKTLIINTIISIILFSSRTDFASLNNLTGIFGLMLIPLAIMTVFGITFFKLGFLKQKKNVVMIILGLALLVIIGLFVLNTYQTTETMKKDAMSSSENALIAATQSKANHVINILKEHEIQLEIAATHQDLSIEELKEIKELNNDFYEIFVLDSNGIIIASSDESKIGLDRINDNYFIGGRTKTHIKDAYFSESTQQNAIAISTPFNEGVLVGRINVDILSKITLDTTGLGQTGEIYLINKEGYMITHSIFREDTFLKQKVDTANAENCLSMFEEGEHKHIGHEAVRVSQDYRGISVLGSHVPIQEMDWCLLAEIDEEEALAKTIKSTNNVWFFTGGMILTIIIIGLVFNFLLTKTLRKEVDDKTEEIQKINKNLEGMIEARTEELDNKSKELEHLNINLETQVDKKTEQIQKKLEEEARTTEAMVYILERANKTNVNLDKSKREIEQKSEELQAQSEELQTTNEGLLRTQKELEEQSQQLQDRTAQLQEKTAGLELSKDHIKKLLESKSRFMNQVAHDLRTPLTPIVTLLPIIKSVEKDKQSIKDLNVVIDNSKYLNSLLEDVLSLARLDAGTVKSQLEKSDIVQIIKQVLSNNGVVFRDMKISAINDIKNKKIPFVMADALKITEVLNNLASNALKFVPKNGKIWFDVIKKGNYVEVSVKDNGIGIAKDRVNHIFEEFYKVDPSRHAHGTGLGLSICKRTIEEIHHGKMWAKSSGKGRGTTFYFTIPIWTTKLEGKYNNQRQGDDSKK